MDGVSKVFFVSIAALNYSSRTTGLPKGCAISVYSMVAHCVQQQMVRDYGMQKLKEQGRPLPESNDVSLAYVPFYHASKLYRMDEIRCFKLTSC